MRTDRDPITNYDPQYPGSRQIDPEFVIDQRAIDAVRQFKTSMRGLLKPGVGRIEDKLVHYKTLNKKLSEIYGIREPRLVVLFTQEDPRRGSSMTSYYLLPPVHKICLRGKFSIITFLHEFSHARGYGEEFAALYSSSLWAREFPESARNITPEEGSHLITVNTSPRRPRRSGWHRQPRAHSKAYYKGRRARYKP